MSDEGKYSAVWYAEQNLARANAEIERLKADPRREEGEGNAMRVNYCARCGNIFRDGRTELAVNVEVCAPCDQLIEAQAENAALNNEVRLLHNDSTTHGALLALVEQLAGALEAALEHLAQWGNGEGCDLPNCGECESEQGTRYKIDTALAAAAEYRKERG